MTCKCNTKPALTARTVLVDRSLVVDANGVAWWVNFGAGALVKAEFDYEIMPRYGNRR